MAGVVLAVLAGAFLSRGLLPSTALAPGVDDQQRLSPFQRAKVESLLANRLPCLGCHEINGGGGQLGPDLKDVGARMSASAIEQHLIDPRTRNPASIMPPVPMPSLWRSAVARYLADGHRGPAASPTSPTIPDKAKSNGSPGDPVDSASTYRTLCGGCHGDTGQGDGPNAKHLPIAPTRHVDAAVMATRTDDWLFDVIARGGYPMNRHPFMPPYAGLLSPDQIRELVAHLRRLCGCAAPLWSRDGPRPGRRS